MDNPYVLVYVAPHILTDFPLQYMITNAPRWLRTGVAVEEVIDTPLTQADFCAHRNKFAPYNIDVFMVPAVGRRKKLLLSDMDATIVEGETLDDLAAVAGIKDVVASITERAMRGEIDFQTALRERVGMLKNLPVQSLDTTLAQMKLTKGAREIVSVMRHHGATCVLVSGGFDFFTGAIAAQCGFDTHHGNRLGVEGDVLTGEVIPPILDKDTKYRLLTEYTNHMGLHPAETMAVGDGANDIPMLMAAGLGVGYRPKPLVKEHVQNCIIYSDHTSLLYMQGYTGDEIDNIVMAGV